jgi:hypothetical protein
MAELKEAISKLFAPPENATGAWRVFAANWPGSSASSPRALPFSICFFENITFVSLARPLPSGQSGTCPGQG